MRLSRQQILQIEGGLTWQNRATGLERWVADLDGLEHVPVASNRRLVMAGLVPAIHALQHAPKTWMRGTSPRMTMVKCDRNLP